MQERNEDLLLNAIEKGNAEFIVQLLKHDKELLNKEIGVLNNHIYPFFYKLTALHKAVTCNKPDIACLLIAAGADINAHASTHTSQAPVTPLDIIIDTIPPNNPPHAGLRGYHDMYVLLRKSGATTNKQLIGVTNLDTTFQNFENLDEVSVFGKLDINQKFNKNEWYDILEYAPCSKHPEGQMPHLEFLKRDIQKLPPEMIDYVAGYMEDHTFEYKPSTVIAKNYLLTNSKTEIVRDFIREQDKPKSFEDKYKDKKNNYQGTQR